MNNFRKGIIVTVIVSIAVSSGVSLIFYSMAETSAQERYALEEKRHISDVESQERVAESDVYNRDDLKGNRIWNKTSNQFEINYTLTTTNNTLGMRDSVTATKNP